MKTLPNGLTVDDQMTTPSRPGKKPRPVWVVGGATAGLEQALLDLGGRKWRGAYSFFDDPTAALESLGENDRLSYAERVERDRERAAARAERFETYAENAQKRAEEAHRKVRAVADMIPLGQPILVGHHSEGRHRRDLDRIHNGMGKSIAERDKAEHWERRAEIAEKKAEGAHSAAFCDRRVKDAETEIRDLERRLERLPAQRERHPDPKNDWDGYETRLRLALADATQKRGYWADAREAAGGVPHSKDTIRKGDSVLTRFGRWRKVVRVNPTTVSIETDYSWTDRLPYAEIRGHRPKEES
jgi:hypothetical protein